MTLALLEPLPLPLPLHTHHIAVPLMTRAQVP